jgi:hypothetical protein
MAPEDQLCGAAAHSAAAMSPHYEEFGHFANPFRQEARHDEAGQSAIVANEVCLTVAPVDKVMVEEAVDEGAVLGELNGTFGRQVMPVQLQEIGKHCLVPLGDPLQFDFHVFCTS